MLRDKLPETFVDDMRELLGQEELLKYLDAIDDRSLTGIRFNTRKLAPECFEEAVPFLSDRIPFTDNAYYVDDTDAASKHPYYFAGLYYIQEPSAMLPARILDVNEGDFVLDLCAAPGGKSTAIAAKCPAFLLSNDISYSRTIPLVKNLELFGMDSFLVSAENPERLSEHYPEYFNKILVDAPCSGEGMFRRDPSLINSFIERGPKDYHDLQFEIADYAVKMLCPGGELVYSTCTFSTLEDEMVIGRLLDAHSELELVPIDKDYGLAPGFNIPEYPEYDFSKCLRAFPHRVKGEGHFVAKLRKAGTCDTLQRGKSKPLKLPKVPDEVTSFLSHLSGKISQYKCYVNNDFVYLLSSEAEQSLKKNLHYSRTGILAGKLKNGKYFEASSSLALALKKDEFDNVLELPCQDERVIKYLKGETIMSKETDPQLKKGYTMITVDGYPLGFTKYDGSKHKNLYTPGWRYNGT